MNTAGSKTANNRINDDRKRPRTSPRLRLSPKSSPKSKPKSKVKAKNPKRQDSEGWHSIRDIIDEKKERGRIWYLIDWDGTDQNGRRYDPTWEPATNVTKVAIDAWRDKKNQGSKVADVTAPGRDKHLPPPESTQETDPVQPLNWRRGKRKRKLRQNSDGILTGSSSSTQGNIHKRRRTDGPSAASHIEVPHAESGDQPITSSGIRSDIVDQEAGKETQLAPATRFEKNRIVVELTGAPSTWTRSEFRVIAPSNSSQEVSQATLPKCIGASGTVVSDQRVIADSQEISGTSASEAHSSHPHPPDFFVESQFSVDPSIPREPLENSPHASPSTDIPSHQPDARFPGVSGVFTDLTISINSAAEAVTNPNRSLVHTSFTAPSQEPVHEIGPIFQTQVESNLSDIIATASTVTTSHGGTIPASFRGHPSAEASRGTDSQYPHITSSASTPTASQAAQLIQPLHSRPTTSQSQSDFSVLDEDKTVSETIPRPQESQGSQGLSQPLSELSDNIGISRTPDKECELGASIVPSEESQLIRQRGERPDLSCGATDTLHQSRPATPVTANKMDSSPAVETPLSAKERLRRFREGHFNRPSAAGSSPAPLAEVSNAARSPSPRVETHTDSEKASTGNAPIPLASPMLLHPPGATQTQAEPYFDAAEAHISPDPLQSRIAADIGSMASYHTLQDEQPTTLDPSNLTLSIENDVDGSPSVPTDDGLDSGHPVPRSTNSSEEETHAAYPRSFLSHVPTGPWEYLITLPFQSSSRTQYNDIIRENEALMIEYNASFRVIPHTTPREDLVDKLDIMFSRLFDICDFPPFLDSLSSLSPEQIAKHVIGTNAKFSFVAELLDDLQALNSDKKVLIFVRPGKLMELLDHVIQTRHCHYIRSGQEVIGAADAKHPLTVGLFSTSDEESSVPKDFDLVIAFDHTFRQELVSSADERVPPLTLALVSIASIQHLNMCIVEDMRPLERKMVLMLALAKAMRFVEDPEPSESLFSIAEKFSRRIQMPDDDDGFYWEPQPLPSEVFDICVASSQIEATQLSAQIQGTDLRDSRKRSHIDDGGDESASKRPKMVQPQVISSLSHISDYLRRLLGDNISQVSENVTVIVPLNKLEALSAKLSELESKLEASKVRETEFRQLSDRAQAESNGYISSIQKIQERYMDALKERGIYEAECKTAQEQASVLSNYLDSSRTETATLKAARAELEKKLTEANEALLHSSNPELVKMAELEKNLDIANKQVQSLEKRMVVVQSDTDYSKNLYNEASRRAAELSAENRVYERKVQELQRQVGENIIEVNKVQNRNEVRILAQQVKEQKNLVREREAELSRIKEELRAMKNGRRETRQSSVPRSPRPSSLGIMSPRNGTRGPSAMGGGPSSSRGTSPQPPPMAVFDAPAGPANGNQNTALFNQGSVANRFAHLRD